ncbi:MAG TPA: methyltransferase domain-containing protein [Terracidiphilus sp.]|nr:methyltransferase domain-containing protein [Terracidiphilus sp.]
MTENRIEAIREDYDRIAAEYAHRFFNELAAKPLDVELLHRFAAEVRERGEVCDLGCGPGHIARRLHDDGVRVIGLDLSSQMVAQARRLNPDIPFREGNMLALDLPSASLAGITAFYAIVNLQVDLLPTAFSELARVLAPGGLLLLAFHLGSDVIRPGELWGQPFRMEFYHFERDTIDQLLEDAGFSIEDVVERGPYPPGVEFQSHRAYVFARKPAAPEC